MRKLIVCAVIILAVAGAGQIPRYLRHQEKVSSARKAFEYISQNPAYYELCIDDLQKALAAGVTLSEIPTTEEGLQRLRRAGCRIVAGEILDALRKGSPEYKTDFEMLREKLKIGNLTLSDLGTSDAELKCFYVHGCALSAAIFYEEGFLSDMKEEMEHGGLSMSDVLAAKVEFDHGPGGSFRPTN